MLRRGLNGAAGVLAGLALLTGCGSDDNAARSAGDAAQTATPTASTAVDRGADKRIAEESVTTLEDFPSGWTQAGQPGRSRVSCPAITAARRDASGVAKSPEFSHGSNMQVADAVYVFADEAAATGAFEAITSRETRLCYAKQVVKAISGAGGLKVGEVKSAHLSLDPSATSAPPRA